MNLSIQTPNKRKEVMERRLSTRDKSSFKSTIIPENNRRDKESRREDNRTMKTVSKRQEEI